MTKRTPPRLTSAAGVVLLEVLVSILILAFAVLAMIGLQASAIQHTTAAKYRLDASFIANGRIGEMWARPAALAEFAETDTNISTLLPEGKRTTVIDGRRATVTVTWQAPNASGPSNVVVVAHIQI